MKQARISILWVSLLCTVVTWAQDALFSGTVIDKTGEPIIGASVMEKGSSRGSATDLNGKFTFKGQPGATLAISYIGYVTQEKKGTSDMHITLLEDRKNLSEIMVIGYGIQKKSVVTASIAKIDASDLAETAPVRVDNALKGLADGVNVTSNSGRPGAAARIRVRSTGTINNSDPFYIIDGIPYEGSFGIDALNPNDIESIEVLKGAASGAIYGARAANGVILIDINGNAVTTGTDWQYLVFNDNAPVEKHDVSVNGGNDRVKYYLSMGYYDQEGIVGGNYGKSNYNRLTFRSNTNMNIFDVTKDCSFLNKLDFSVSLSYARIKSTGIESNSTWGSVLGSALALSPILPPYVTGQAAIDQHNRYTYTDYFKDAKGVQTPYQDMTDKNGNVVMIPGTAYNEINNPLGLLLEPSQPGRSHHFIQCSFLCHSQFGIGR